MVKLRATRLPALAVIFMVVGCSAGSDTQAVSAIEAPTGKSSIEVTEKSFKCIREMTPVRGFFVDNIAGNLEGTLAVANSPKGGVYPAGSVVQLFPNEVMVKREPGFNPVTHDWEFYELDVSESGSKIRTRGFADVKNRFGGNCFGCHAGARPEWDMICEQDHGCGALPIGDVAIKSLQNTDPRCKPKEDLPFSQRVMAWFIKTFTSL